MTDTSVQWDKACKTLDEEFQLSANELPTIETAKALFCSWWDAATSRKKRPML